MDIFIGRQPIFTKENKVYAYELLYRDNSQNNRAVITDPSKATKTLVADAVNIFDINKLTCGKGAFINFNKELIVNDFIKVLNPENVVIELLEFIDYDDEIVDCLIKLRQEGYRFAIDDYDGTKDISRALPYVSTIKVDFLLTDDETQRRIAKQFENSGKQLLAEKVETIEDFNKAVAYGYDLFQGYYFARPSILREKYIDSSYHNYAKIMKYTQENNFNHSQLAQIIRTDVVLSYHLMRKIKTMQYFRGVPVKDIESALMRMGESNFRRWISLMMVRGMNGKSDELLKLAYMRGRFIEELMKASDKRSIIDQSNNGFMVGMFSLMPAITDTSINELLREIDISYDSYAALTRSDCDNELSTYLRIAKAYEKGDSAQLKELMQDIDIDENQLVKIYIECLKESDEVFKIEDAADEAWASYYKNYSK